MNFLDPRTVIILTSVMSAMMALVLIFLRRNYPPSIKGLAEWATSAALLFLASLLASLRGKVSDLITIALPHVTLFAGIYVAYLGTQRFLGLTPDVRRWFAPLAAIAGVAFWFTLIEPNYRMRLMLLSLPVGLVFAMHAFLIFSKAARTFSSWLAMTTLLIACATQMLRFLTVWLRPDETSLFQQTSPQALYVSVYAFMIVLFSISVVLMATERLRAELEHLATHDSLTDAFTRRHMNEACHQELERCRRHGHVMSLLIMDLDNFKIINDTYGHQRGDRVLVEFVDQVKSLLRRPDQLGRFGGEEFVLLLPETPLEVALVVAERIRAKVDESGADPHFTVSIGVTTNRHDYDSLDTLLARADTALYRAKERGRNRVESA